MRQKKLDELHTTLTNRKFRNLFQRFKVCLTCLLEASSKPTRLQDSLSYTPSWHIRYFMVGTESLLVPMSAPFAEEDTAPTKSSFRSTRSCIDKMRVDKCLTRPQPAPERIDRHAELSLRSLIETSTSSKNQE